MSPLLHLLLRRLDFAIIRLPFHISSHSHSYISVNAIIYDRKSDNDIAENKHTKAKKKENSFNEDVQAWLMKLLLIFDCRLVTITSVKTFINEIIFLVFLRKNILKLEYFASLEKSFSRSDLFTQMRKFPYFASLNHYFLPPSLSFALSFHFILLLSLRIYLKGT